MSTYSHSEQRSGGSLGGSRRAVTAVAATLLGLVGIVVGVATATSAAAAPCSVDYRVVNQWPGGFQGAIEITNTGDAIDGWTLQFDMPDGQTINQGWIGQFSQAGATVSVASMSWNGSLAPGASVTPGFIGSYNGANGVPSSFSLNGEACDTGTPPSTTAPPTTAPSTTAPSTTAPSSTAPSTTGPSTTAPSTTGPSTTIPSTTTPSTTTPTTTPPSTNPPQPGERLDNPYLGAKGYVSPEWRENVIETADAVGGSIAADMRKVADIPAAIWLDRIGAIAGDSSRMGLREHLDEAVVQAGGDPLVIQVVIYDLPNRDCAALASNGELRISEGGFERYKTEYIDEIVSIMKDPKYSDLRIVNIIEPDSLPNLVTNLSEPDCQEASGAGGYAEGIAYALGQLRTVPNTYAYIDIGHSGWLGWDSNFGPAAKVIADAVKLPAAGVDTVDGFISNTSGVTPTEEPFLEDIQLPGANLPLRSAKFFEWNPYFDETSFVQAIRLEFIKNGLNSDIGMLIDTSRNGWGGPDRPTAASSSTDIDTYVNESRIDRRPHRGGWCNQSGAGIGNRPQAAPAAGIDAYVWVKPPGESDGISRDGVVDPNDPAKGFDPMCDPNAQNRYDNQFPTNALDGAPHAGRWFADQFEMLVRNAYPAVS